MFPKTYGHGGILSFTEALKELGIKKAAFARYVGKTPAAITQWGDFPPNEIGIMVNQMVTMKRIADAIYAEIDHAKAS